MLLGGHRRSRVSGTLAHHPAPRFAGEGSTGTLYLQVRLEPLLRPHPARVAHHEPADTRRTPDAVVLFDEVGELVGHAVAPIS